LKTCFYESLVWDRSLCLKFVSVFVELSVLDDDIPVGSWP
jgi:hypothetical protein